MFKQINSNIAFIGAVNASVEDIEDIINEVRFHRPHISMWKKFHQKYNFWNFEFTELEQNLDLKGRSEMVHLLMDRMMEMSSDELVYIISGLSVEKQDNCWEMRFQLPPYRECCGEDFNQTKKDFIEYLKYYDIH